jgi:hypothetical protein
MSQAHPSQRFWCRVRLSLDDVKQLLAEPFELLNCESDCENVFEWFEGKDAEGSFWNVSRKHDGNGQSDFEDYLIIGVFPVPENPDAVGQKLSNTLLCSVSFGAGAYDKSNFWKYVEQKKFSPNP